MGKFQDRCEMILAHMRSTIEFAGTLDSSKGLTIADFNRLLSVFADELENAIDDHPLLCEIDRKIKHGDELQSEEGMYGETQVTYGDIAVTFNTIGEAS